MIRRVALISSMILTSVWACFAQDTVLPPLDQILPDHDAAPDTRSLEIQGFNFEGNTVFSNEQLAELLTSYLLKEITADNLEGARRALTLHYVNHGYVNSGAVLEDQSFANGVITFRIVEGVLSKINISGRQQLNEAYLTNRITLGAGTPLNVLSLKNRLELLRDNPNIKSINAELRPGLIAGDSFLDVTLEEDDAFHVALRFDNHRSPSIGAERFSLLAWHTNLTGHADRIFLDYGVTKNGFDDIDLSGKDNMSVSYTIPITVHDTTLTVTYARSDTLVIEEPFANLDIASELQEFSVALRHPLYRTVGSELAVAVAGERRENETFLLGSPFSFSPGARNGESDVTVLRFDVEFVARDQQRALAMRSTLRVGLDALDATVGGAADGQFVSWLGSLQYVQRLGQTNHQALFRISTQMTDSSLLSLEQFALGGVNTIRGYRENQVVRDNGVVVSGELRVPLAYDANGQTILSLVPFVDFGYGWDEARTNDSINLTSAGAGLLLHLDQTLNAQFYWGHPFRDFNDTEDDVQDLGIHFQITWQGF